MELYYPCSENKGACQLRGYREADLRLCILGFLVKREFYFVPSDDRAFSANYLGRFLAPSAMNPPLTGDCQRTAVENWTRTMNLPTL